MPARSWAGIVAGRSGPGLVEETASLALLLVKLAPAPLLRFGYPWRETLAGGALLSSRLSLIIAASAIGLELGLISGAKAGLVYPKMYPCPIP